MRHLYMYDIHVLLCVSIWPPATHGMGHANAGVKAMIKFIEEVECKKYV
jgi:hypothetical protein